jgi:uncharacterized protein (DUF305 family)
MNKIQHSFAAPIVACLMAVIAMAAGAPDASAQTRETGPAIDIPTNGPVVPTPVGPASPEAIAQARTDSLRRPYTAADIAFMSGMISHHSQAVLMSSWAKSHGASPGLQTFAARIAMAQMAEISLMQNWLRDRNQPVPPADPHGMMMKMDGMDMSQPMLMPGMLTEEQMKQLDAARGVEFDRLFLTDMMQHHNGAIQMVTKLFNTDGAAQDEFTFKFANDVQADQTTEIERMQRMLDALPPKKK